MIKIKLDLEKIILVIFITIFLFIGLGSIFNHKIKHDFPNGYFASDAFQHQVRAEAIKDAGNFRYEANYISKGFEKVVGRYPPFIYHLSVILSYSSGIEVYDSIYFVALFFAVIAALLMYLIINDFNKSIALISLPLTFLIFTNPIVAGFTWGHWPSLLSQMFLLAFFWGIMRIELAKSYLLISAFFAAIIMTHTSEAVFAVMFLGIFFVTKFLTKNLKISEIKTIIIAFVISFILSLYYLIIFKDTLAKGETYKFIIEPIWQGNPGFYIMDFGVLSIFIVIGIIFSLLKLKEVHASLILALVMLISGFLNYIGFGLRSFQIRFFWPIYLSVFFGFGIYILLKFVIKKWNQTYSLAIFVILTIILTGVIKIPKIPQYNKLTSQGIMDSYHWSALTWLSKNTAINSKIYFFYGDIYSQDALLRNSKRVHYQIDPDDFVKAIQEKKIKRSYISELPGDSGGSLAGRISWFKLKDISADKPHEYFFGPQDICKFDYLVFDKPKNDNDIKVYNMIILSEMLKKNFIENVFENKVLIILKNNKAGADCIEERNF